MNVNVFNKFARLLIAITRLTMDVWQRISEVDAREHDVMMLVQSLLYSLDPGLEQDRDDEPVQEN